MRHTQAISRCRPVVPMHAASFLPLPPADSRLEKVLDTILDFVSLLFTGYPWPPIAT